MTHDRSRGQDIRELLCVLENGMKIDVKRLPTNSGKGTVAFKNEGNLVTIIKALSGYVHSKGLKLGIYSDDVESSFLGLELEKGKSVFDSIKQRKGMESIEITTLEDENEIKVVLAESKERKPARKWWSY
ncbi:hypothetical protein F2Q68_00028114 [Brassica cretica]|uniref:Uncharacterized protein n=1 Tax=Brassica cretica TaxID=69181 RepID=A0A8S9I7C8_BRACR|nr:hypothetical protein F2Q68_00028114 [Brassica cretica]